MLSSAASCRWSVAREVTGGGKIRQVEPWLVPQIDPSVPQPVFTITGAFNQEKALVGAFSVIVQPVVEPMDRFVALVIMYSVSPCGRAEPGPGPG